MRALKNQTVDYIDSACRCGQKRDYIDENCITWKRAYICHAWFDDGVCQLFNGRIEKMKGTKYVHIGR